jgi:hypothetical protein
MIRNPFFFFLLFIGLTAQAQVGINILNPDTSAILHLESTTRGFLPPRMNTAQRDAIPSPVPGLQIYNLQDSVMQYFNGTCWLNVWQRGCDDCGFIFTIDDQMDTIDRIFVNSVSTDLNVEQLTGTPTDIALFILPNLPAGMTATISPPIVLGGTGAATLTVTASIFTQPGTYPVIVQAVCGYSQSSQVYLIVVEPCIEVDIVSNQFNYNLQQANSLPTNIPICVVVDIANGVAITNNLNAPAAFNYGTLHPQSQVGINNAGGIFARGGDGAFGGNFQNFGNPGGNGTHAIDMTCQTAIINNGFIFGGGGGGGSVGLGVNIPVVNINLGIGAGGGGGAADGQGGAQAFPIPVWADGNDAGNGQNGLGGQGGTLSVPINLNFPPVAVSITPNANGGDGGNYGFDGSGGNLFVNLLVQIQVPFIGTITLLNANLPNPPIQNFPPGGAAGNAVKRNGFLLNGVSDGFYNTSNVKGRVGP